MKKTPQFRITLHRTGYHETPDQIPPELDLPASHYELQDLLDRARIDGPCQPYKIRIFDCRHEFIYNKLVHQELKLHELNHLANRLSELSGRGLDALEGLMKTNPLTPTVATLINFTHTVDDVEITYAVRDDEQLGKWSVENGYNQELSKLPVNIQKYLDYEKIGLERRNDEMGAYTSVGYIVNLKWPQISQAYDPDNPPWAEEEPCEAGLVVDFSGSQQDTGECRMDLPISDAVYSNLLEALYCKEDDLVTRPTSCMVPFMMQHVKMHEDIGTLNAFAVCVDGLHALGKLPLYMEPHGQGRCRTMLCPRP